MAELTEWAALLFSSTMVAMRSMLRASGLASSEQRRTQRRARNTSCAYGRSLSGMRATSDAALSATYQSHPPELCVGTLVSFAILASMPGT